MSSTRQTSRYHRMDGWMERGIRKRHGRSTHSSHRFVWSETSTSSADQTSPSAFFYFPGEERNYVEQHIEMVITLRFIVVLPDFSKVESTLVKLRSKRRMSEIRCTVCRYTSACYYLCMSRYNVDYMLVRFIVGKLQVLDNAADGEEVLASSRYLSFILSDDARWVSCGDRS